uniref:Cytochrome P450 n=1 Tax=Acrobeloides nanus TaxID=290746 RepID=A0A914ENY0_9BILA
MPTVDDSVNVMMTHLKKVADSGKAFNIHPYFHELTMDVICRIAMGQRGTRQFENPHVDVCKRVFAHFGVDRLSMFAFLFPFDWFIWCLRRFAFVTANLRKAPFKELLDILRKEIKERKELRDVTYEQLQSLKYGDAVMKEALRMIPIAAFAASRECNETTTLGNILIEKGTQVQVDVFTLHYDKDFWGEDAEKFVPERFLDNKTRHPGAFIPFGGGPRTCIGIRLAYMEEKLALVKILKEYDVVECEETEKELKLVGSSVLNPEAVTIKLVKRFKE